ncbi:MULTISPECIES: hypothetical protein [Flavobacterium]|uniref:ASCH domain-containing protein n=1 Tax=Flavobacterium keumense TaxID=1306518 RepID=A0ABY8N2C4_9FLAO|nr:MULTISPECIES: hypothetical protein [Flavobacterium]WGK93818.1 hypothetical protein MG292_06865 [Flavobacterium keumense]
MKTITLQGEFQKFENLNQATSKFDKNRLPYEVETRIYVLDTADFGEQEKHYSDLTNEEFQSLAEEQGRVYTLEGFQEAFNLGEINSSIDFIRFINVKI